MLTLPGSDDKIEKTNTNRMKFGIDDEGDKDSGFCTYREPGEVKAGGVSLEFVTPESFS